MPADLPDRALRSALEFAVGIAAAGAKLRPPLAFPPALKPFLRFHKLPPPALATVRAAVEADGEFLRRLGLVATAELVDEVGMLWLTRPDGWQDSAATLLADAAADDRAADDVTELRREQRRREAAEAAASRSRLELMALQEQLEAERRGRSAAEADVARLAADLSAAHERLRQMERAVQKRSAGADAATQQSGTLAAELQEARAELAVVTAARDAALADRAVAHAGVGGDMERVRSLLAEALAAAGGQSSSRRGRTQRSPIALPGGVYGNSEAAAEHLLRTTDVLVLVDGYNVAKLGWPGLSLEQQRDRCIEAAENLARRWGTLVHVVFDGTTVVGASVRGRARRLVRVTFSPEGVIADDVLRAEVAALDVARPVVVVTNDQAVVTDVRTMGANVVTSDTFLALARR